MIACRALIRCVVVAVLLFAGVGSMAADKSPTFLGIGLDDAASAIQARLMQTPGIQSSHQRPYADGSIERQFDLRDGSFVRAVFVNDKPDATAKFLSFAGGTTLSAPDTGAALSRQLGGPTWQRKGDGGVTLRQVWGGVGAPEAGIIPHPNVAVVVECVTSDGRVQTLTMARPSWFQSGKKR